MLPENSKSSEPFIKNGHSIQKHKRESSVDDSWNIEFIYFSWISRLMCKSLKHGLTIADICDCSASESVEVNGKRFDALWQRECRDANGIHNASLLKAWICFVKKRVAISTLFYLLCLSFGYLSGIFLLRQLLTFIEGPENSFTIGLLWAFLLALAEFLRVTCFSIMYAISTRTTIRAGSALNAVIYKKLLTARNISNKRIGEITNLFTIDCSKVTQLVHTIPLLIGSPVIIVITFIYTFHLFGIHSIFSISLFVISLWTQIFLAKIISKIRKKVIATSDQRVSLVSETMSSIKFVKYCALEDALFDKINEFRRKETQYLKKCQYLHCINVSLSLMVPIMATIITILAFTFFDNNLTAVQAFSLVMLNNIASQGIRLLPVTIREVIQAKVSLKRIEQIMRQEEKYFYRPSIKSSDALQFCKTKLNANPNVKECNCTHENECEKFSISKQQLVGIVGSVGSGKTTLLKQISGEISGNVSVNGTIAYLSQQPFLFSETIQENIIFGLQFNEKKYSEVIHCCALHEDLESLPDGDRSVVGERALKLSGGQKQRIALSRTVYADRDIYLLDDPLSALDVNTAQFVFENCIRQALRSKTVIMVTSQTTFLKYMDLIIFMKDGLMYKSGTHSELLQLTEYSNLISHLCVFEKDIKKKSIASVSSSSEYSHKLMPRKLMKINEQPNQKLDTNEESPIVTPNVFEIYIKAFGGRICFFAVVLPFVVFAVITNFSQGWLSQWIANMNIGYGNQTLNKVTIVEKKQSLHYYQIVYGSSVVLLIFSALISSFLWTSVAMKASNRLHHELLSKILQSSVCLFERTETGKRLHLLTKDIEEVDNQVPRTVASFLNRFLVVVFNIITVIYVYPSFSIPMSVIIIIFTTIYKVFKGALSDLKRIEAKLRSPVLTHVCNTYNGLVTITTFNKEKFFTKKFNALCNKYWAAHYLHLSSMRWMFIRLDLLCVLTTLIASIFSISYKNFIGVSFAALAITLSMQLCNNLQVVVRLGCDVETRFTAVERIACFIQNATCEEIKEQQLNSGEWPKKGAICFKNVSMKYGNECPSVLLNISFEVKPKEIIGIIGKTAAGKSSLAAALFRLSSYISGNIFIDGFDTNEMPLKTLRSNMTIIPQDVVLFFGTIRFNLDPYSQYTDEQLFTALEKAALKSKILAIPGALDAVISENANTFSVGEKRLFYVAKAFLNNSKIIIFDEATSSVDCITEDIIQRTMNEAFENSTVLIITHNLRTVLNCDRIFVMQSGTIVDVDLPQNLIQKNIFTE